jgi:uncharacterized protein
MRYRRFGRTEIQMPVFSCGGMRYQHGWQDAPLDKIPPDNQANLEATIRKAVDVGINHIETARGYGSSERQLGLILPTFPRDQLIVQTKVGPKPDAAAFVADFEDSRQRLQLDYVDLLAFHGVNTHRDLWWVTRDGGCLQAARQLQREGKVRHVGFSTHGDTDVIVDAINWDRDGGLDYVNLHYYFIFQNHKPAIEAATKQDLGVFIISPADKGGMLYQPPDKLVALCDPLHPLVFNCLWCLQQPAVHTLSLGAARPSDFDLQLSSLEKLDAAATLLPPIEQRLSAAMDAAVGEGYFARFREGLAETLNQPGHIAVETILWLRALALGWGLTDYAKMRYGLLGNAGSWFYGNNALNADVYAEKLTKSNSQSPFADQLPDQLTDAHDRFWSAPQTRLSES